ncbi:MAG: PKD domain-containing protein [Bacteroidota bacterium]
MKSKLLLLFSIFQITLFIQSAAQAPVNGYAQVIGISGNTINVASVNEIYDTFEDGEKIIIMQMQDDVIGDTSNTASFGNISTIQSAGLYEYATILSHTEIAGIVTSITTSGSLTNVYNIGTNSSVQLISYPALGSPNFTTTSDIAGLPWNGNIGGVIAFEVNGTLNLNNNISADGIGFRGGQKSAAYGTFTNGCDEFVFKDVPRYYGAKGEGIYKNSSPQWNNARGKILNGAGGGNEYNSGGGGGGGFTRGGEGGPGYGCFNAPNGVGGKGGIALLPYIDISATRLYMGGGGGGGQEDTFTATDGVSGGGIVIIKANKIKTPLSCTGISITANGNSNNLTAPGDGAGGAGAGGSITINCPDFDIVNAGCFLVSANGGKGGDCPCNCGTVGGGGGGGQGSIIYTDCIPAIVLNKSFTKNGLGGANDLNETSFAENGDSTDNLGIFYRPQPLPFFSNTTICNGNTTQFTDSSFTTIGTINTWTWNFGDGSPVNNSPSPSHLYANPGNYNATLIVNNSVGCTDTLTKSVQVYYDPIAGFTSNGACFGDSAHFTNTSSVDNSTSITGYAWTFGDGSPTNSLTDPNHFYPSAGTYSVTLLATTIDGCSNTFNSNVTVHPPPIAVAVSNSPVTIGSSINLSTDTVSGIVWSGPNSFTSVQQNPTITNAQIIDSGTYQVIKTNSLGCKDTAEVLVTVYQPEIPDNLIDDDLDSLIDCADPDLATLNQCYICGYDSIAWKTVLPEPGFNKGIAVKYTGFTQHFIVPAGVTSIKVKAWGAGGGGCCYASIAGGAGGYTTDNLTTSAGETYIIVSGEGGWTTRWLNQTARSTFGFGGSGNSTGATGISEVSSGGGLSGLFFSSLTQSNARVIAGGGGGSGDVGNSDETSGGNGNNPLSGGYLPLMGQNGSAGFGGGGGGYVGGISGIGRFFSITVADAGEGGSGFKFTSGGQIKFTPELDLNPPEMTDVHYLSGHGLGGVSNTPIGLAGDLKSGGDGFVVIQWFEPVDDLTITASKDSICKGDTLTLVASGQSNYLWSPATTLSSDTAKMVIASPINDITYQVISNYNNCKDTAEIQIVVHQLPDLTLSPDSSVCIGDSLQINVSGAFSYSWFPVSGLNTSSGAAVTAGPLVDTKYYVVGTDNNNCSATDSLIITVDSLPIASITGIASICNGNSTTLTASGGNTYLWSTGITNVAITIAPSATAPYMVIVKNNNNCIDTATSLVEVHPLPVPQFSAPNVCEGSSVGFSNLSTVNSPDSIQSYAWNFGDGSSINSAQNPSHVFALDSSYSVQLTAVSNFGCVDSITKISIVNPNPIVSFSANDTVGCEPLCISFQNSASVLNGSIVQWIWNVGDGSSAINSQSFDHCYTNDSVYSANFFDVSLTVISDSGCMSSFSKNNYITVYPSPDAGFTVQPQTATITNPLISITDLSTGTDFWSFDFGDTQVTSMQNPAPHIYPDPGTYIITLITSTQYNCLDTASQTISIEPDFVFYIPNAFSPDGDGINDSFSGRGIFIKEFKMNIFDRWGNMIFVSEDINKPWDGTANRGKEIALADVYIYSIIATDFKNRKHNYKGIVSLIK